MARRRSGLFYIRFQEVISHVQEHKRKQAFSGFLAFSIKKEISDRLKILFPFFVPAAAQYVFAAEKKKTTASQGLPTVRGLFQFIMTYVFLLFVSVIMGINKSPQTNLKPHQWHDRYHFSYIYSQIPPTRLPCKHWHGPL